MDGLEGILLLAWKGIFFLWKDLEVIVNDN